MQLTLDDREIALLETTLDTALGRLREELHHTKTPDYRDELKVHEQLLRSMLAKLRGTSDVMSPPARVPLDRPSLR